MEAPTPHPERVLLVEADPAVRSHLGSELAQAGHTVLSVASGEEAIAQFAGFAPTAVVADMSARLNDGTPIVDAIRTHTEGDPVPILVLGDSEHIEEFQRMLQLGKVWYIGRRAEWPQFERTFATMRARSEVGMSL